MSLQASLVGRFAHEAASLGEGEVCAVFRRSCYLRFAGERYACVGDTSLGRGPLNALVDELTLPAIGERIALSTAGAQIWTPSPLPQPAIPDVRSLHRAAGGRVPREGLGSLVVDQRNSLSGQLRPLAAAAYVARRPLTLLDLPAARRMRQAAERTLNDFFAAWLQGTPRRSL